MEVTIKNVSSRVLLERTDNGVIIYDVNEENSVVSKVAYEVYFKDGILDFQTMSVMLLETMELLGIPTQEVSTNRQLSMVITKIDPTKPSIGEEPND